MGRGSGPLQMRARHAACASAPLAVAPLPLSKKKKYTFPSPSQAGKCYGCGAPVQLHTPGEAGYVELDAAAAKAAHRQPGMLLCARCRSLAQGGLQVAVAEDLPASPAALLAKHGEALAARARDWCAEQAARARRPRSRPPK